MTLREFISTAYALASNRQWALLVEFFALTRLLVTAPTATITAGKPVDKKD